MKPYKKFVNRHAKTITYDDYTHLLVNKYLSTDNDDELLVKFENVQEIKSRLMTPEWNEIEDKRKERQAKADENDKNGVLKPTFERPSVWS